MGGIRRGLMMNLKAANRLVRDPTRGDIGAMLTR
jgi:hypothetical protein